MFHVHKKLISQKCSPQICLYSCWWSFLFCQDNLSTRQVWHIKKLIKQHNHYTCAPCAGDSKMCSFVTQHNATDVSSFEAVCNWHADCRNVYQSCCQRIEYSIAASNVIFFNLQDIQPASQLQTCNHVNPGPPHPASSPAGSSETSHPDSWWNWVCTTKETVSGKLICVFIVLTRILTSNQI